MFKLISFRTTYILLLKMDFYLMNLYSYPVIITPVFAFLVHASGEIVVLHSPDSVELTVNGDIEQSNLKECLLAALGYTVKQVCHSTLSLIF